MDTAKFLEILRITVPVFALLGLGNFLSRIGKMTDAHQSFLNWFVYYICLPALIFAGMATQPFSDLLNVRFILGTLLPMLAVFVIFVILALILRLDKKIAVVMIFGTYWANVAYMGFPLAESAFGVRGFLLAAIVNAVTMPILVAVSFVMIGLCSDKPQSLLVSLRGAFFNPVILASIAGLTFSWLLGFVDTGALPVAIKEMFGIGGIILKNIGAMGISIALLAVGGKLRFRSFGKHALPLSLTVGGKLILLPLMTFCAMHFFFPDAPKEDAAAAVLLMAMPTAVTGAVIAAKFKLNEEFTSSVLATSMLFGIIMIPFWLYIVL